MPTRNAPDATADPEANLRALLAERQRFEGLLFRLSTTFTSIAPEAVDAEIEQGLRQTIEFLGIERSSFGQFSPDGAQLLVTHSYTIPGFVPFPRIDLAAVWPWYTEQIRQGHTLQYTCLPDELPPEAVAERAYITRTGGPRSHLAIPFRVGGVILGGVGFGSYRREYAWSDEQVRCLRLVGEIFANAIARKRGSEREADLTARLHRDRADLEPIRRRAATLTPREAEVMALVVRGLINKQIGQLLGVGEKTIKVHRGRVMRKMAAASLADLVRMAERLATCA